jgi:predicted glycoside hydrolase/deacetylase ChbG (UPF0249 family)
MTGAGNSLAARITGDANGRVLVLHVDDLGMCHGANAAFVDLARTGNVTCGSIMVPCPWFREIAAEAAQDKSLDLGVHLTLTSEWPLYRWGPISTVAENSGLIDEQGCFPRNCLALRLRINANAAEIEFRAQIDRALEAGIDVTHLDTHMGAALLPEVVDIYLQLGRDYQLPVLLPRELDSYTGVLKMGETPPDLYAQRVARLDLERQPVFDRFRMTPWVEASRAEGTYREMIQSLPAGATFFGLHCNKPGDIEAIVPPRAHFRTEEYALFKSGAPVRWAREAGIQLTGMREVRDLLREKL